MDDEKRFLILSSGGEFYAIPIARLVEISAPRQILRDPNLSGLFEGKVDYRGKMTPVVNLRKALQMPDQRGGALLFLRGAKGVTGLLVDGVTEIATLDQSPAPMPPGVINPGIRTYRGVLRYHDALALLLDEDVLLP